MVVSDTGDNSHAFSSNVKMCVSVSGVLCLVCCDLWCYFDQAVLTFQLSCFLPGPHQSELHVSALLRGRAVLSPCTLNVDPQGIVQGHQESVWLAGAQSLVGAHSPELPAAILYHAAPSMKKLRLPTHGGGLEAGGFNACKALYLSMAPFIPASQGVHHHHKKIIYSFISRG